MIGWYIHHHGFGHLSRFRAVQPHLRAPVTVFSSLRRPDDLDPAVTWIDLPADADVIEHDDGTRLDPRDGDPTVRGTLHWAPHDHPGHRARFAAIARESTRLSVFVVDVSAEVVALVRLLGLRTLAVTQPGERSDAAHALAYDLADRILAPWAHGAVSATPLTSRADRAIWTGGISRFDGRERADTADDRSVLFLGRALDPELRDAATARLRAAGWTTRSIGYDTDSRVDDPWPLISTSTVVVSAAGQNSIADLAAAEARAVIVAQERPFDEQQHTACALHRWGLARVAPDAIDADALVSLVEAAADDMPDWSRWQVSGAAHRAAAAIEAMLP